MRYQIYDFRYKLHRLFQDGPVACAVCLIALAFCCGGSLWFVQSVQERQIVDDQISRLQTNPAEPILIVNTANGGAAFSSFSSSYFPRIVNDVSNASGSPVEEMNLTLEDAPKEPYVRYRASFRASLEYAGIRKFTAQILDASNDITLDMVSCVRPEIHTAKLSCDFAFSQIYARRRHG